MKYVEKHFSLRIRRRDGSSKLLLGVTGNPPQFPAYDAYLAKVLSRITREEREASASFHIRIKVNQPSRSGLAILRVHPSAPCRAQGQMKAPAIATQSRAGSRSTALAERSSHREIPEHHDERGVCLC
jgi:hypothetical protein